ncbi:MAG: hypothetical protein RMN25_04215 [Anaerolineae bacterium]|nr:hypothetical protein [Thermoflexales bacterium]MDW8406968.1 hypothetical protein [Anaerolineae bacterium]
MSAHPASTFAQSNPLARIIIPTGGQSLRGSVTIQGTANSNQFMRYEIAYAAEPDLATWIVIGGGTQPIENGALAVWNTRPLSEGEYALRVQVFNSDGSVFEGFVRNLKVSNPSNQGGAPNTGASTDQETAGETSAPGDGEAEFDLGAIPAAFMRGARTALLALLAFGAYLALKRAIRFALSRLFAKPTDFGR